MPTYKEITDTKGRRKQEFPPVNVDGSEQDTDTHDSEEDELEEDEFDDVVDRFESSYNFRFEEP